ncbi:conserved hypothetical protein [Vibrio aestuarianus]|nr:conserved hypothetical protein [Vibrio aestuarianus]
MNDLLKLIAEIFQASYALHTELAQARIEAAKETTDIARIIAADKCHDSQVKFAIQGLSGAFTMFISSVSAAKTASGKSLEDRHVAGGRVSDLTQREINQHTATLQNLRIGKYAAVAQTAKMAEGVSRDWMEVHHANEVKIQEEAQATLTLKKELDALIDLVYQHFVRLFTKLNELLDVIEKSHLATNR